MTRIVDARRAASAQRITRDVEFEVALGASIRAARVAAGMSQGTLGEAVGVSFQQVQKYEKATDRVSVVTLRAFATALDLDPRTFLGDEPPAASGTLREMREAQRIGARILALKDPAVVRRIMALVDELASRQKRGRHRR